MQNNHECQECEKFFNSIDGVNNRGWGMGFVCCAPCHPCDDDESADEFPSEITTKQ